jgi:hypothetical protein
MRGVSPVQVLAGVPSFHHGEAASISSCLSTQGRMGKTRGAGEPLRGVAAMRFSLASLLLATLAAAVMCGVLFATPDGLFYLALRLVWYAAAAGTIASIVYRRGAPQAFAIGLLCCAPLTMRYAWDTHPDLELWDDSTVERLVAQWDAVWPAQTARLSVRLEHAAALLLSLACGAVAVAVNVLARRHLQGEAPPMPHPKLRL